MPDALWPNLPQYWQFSAADHAAHTTRRGIHHPQDVDPTMDSRKSAKLLTKFVSKPHLKMSKVQSPRSKVRRKKKT